MNLDPEKMNRSPEKFIVLLFATIVALCALVLFIASTVFGVAPSVLLRDPAAEFSFPLYAGAISSVGIGILLICSAICLFTVLFQTTDRLVLMVAAVLTGWMALDDAFLLHERVFNDKIGIPEEVLAFIYGVTSIWLLVQTRPVRFNQMRPYFLGGLACLGTSVIIDVVSGNSTANVVLEDFLKLSGFAGLGTAFVILAQQNLAALILKETMDQHPTS